MRIHKEGYRIIAFCFIFVIVVLALLNIIFPVQTIIHVILYLAGFGFLLFVTRFFRSPSRQLTPADNKIYSPADGTVVVIEKVKETEYFNDERLQISIFMSAYNVHVNWYPVSGKINYFKYHKGSYIIARHPKSSELNERTSIVLQANNGKEILVRQIAGIVARRIVSYCEEGNEISQGKEMGFIKFGSRLDVFLPLDSKVNLKLKQKVRGAETVLASF
jgi:phosphatidylserine decarboxylase